MFTEFFLLFQNLKKKAKKSHWSGYLPRLEFQEMTKRTPWHKLLQPRTQLNAGFRHQSLTKMSCSNDRPDLLPIREDKEKQYKLMEKRASVKNKSQCASRRKETFISKHSLRKYALNRRLFKTRGQANGKCQTLPQEDETVQHILIECPSPTIFSNQFGYMVLTMQ